MGDILGRIATSGKDATKGFDSLQIGDHINKVSEDRHSQLMMICKGDIAQYDILKYMSTSDYLIKLNKFVDEVELLTKK